MQYIIIKMSLLSNVAQRSWSNVKMRFNKVNNGKCVNYLNLIKLYFGNDAENAIAFCGNWNAALRL